MRLKVYCLKAKSLMKKVYKAKACKKCGQLFSPNSSTGTHCAECCTVICQTCGKRFKVLPGQIASAKYCSRECHIKGRNTIVSHICKKCGQPFKSSSGTSKWCNECRTITCQTCGKRFQISPAYFKTKKYCSRKCQIIGKRTIINHICEKCGKHFESTSGTSKWCNECCTVRCQNCNKKIRINPYKINTTKYCSRKCLVQGRKIRISHICEKCKRSFVSVSPNSKWCNKCCTVICQICNKEFRVKPRRVKLSKYCSRECRRRSDMNYVWKDDDLDFIKQNYPYQISMRELAEKYNTSESAIARIVAKLNLPKCPIEIRQKRVGDAQRYWTKERIISKIREYHKKGKQLNVSNIQKINGSLHYCASQRFGSWKNAVEAAGFDYKEINLYSKRISWTKEMILEKIKRLNDQNVDLMASNIRDNHTALFIAARREKDFGSWEAAIRATGLNYEEICGNRWGQKYQGKDGNLYFSIIEGKVGDILFDLVSRKQIVDYETQVRVTKKRNWTCDFVVEMVSGEQIWLEVDGLEDSRKDGAYNKNNEKIHYYEKKNFNYCIVTNPQEVKEKLRLPVHVS